MLVAAFAFAQSQGSVRVGNYLVTAPNAVALVEPHRSAEVVDFGGEYAAGTSAPDETYHAQRLKVEETTVLLEWGRFGDGAIGRLTCGRPVAVPVRFVTNAWPGLGFGYAVNGRRVPTFPNEAGMTAGILGRGMRFDQPLSQTSEDRFTL